MADGRPVVSGPGRFSARSDKGIAQMDSAGGPYGSRQQLEAQQSAAPVPVGQRQAAASTPSPQGGGDVGVFGPTERPGEPASAGMVGVTPPGGPSPLHDPNMIFRVLADKWPTPWILGMLNEH